MERLRRRDIYKFASECILDHDNQIATTEKMKVDIISYSNSEVKMDDIEVVIGKNTFAKGSSNPVDCVNFYNKHNIKSKCAV